MSTVCLRSSRWSITLRMLLESDLLKTTPGLFSRNKSSAYTGKLVLLLGTMTPIRFAGVPGSSCEGILKSFAASHVFAKFPKGPTTPPECEGHYVAHRAKLCARLINHPSPGISRDPPDLRAPNGIPCRRAISARKKWTRPCAIRALSPLRRCSWRPGDGVTAPSK